MSDFHFALCAPGAEGALKRELPGPAAYQRPGFVTFKAERVGELVFAREWSRSLGRVSTLEGIEADVIRVSAREPALAEEAARLRVDARAPRPGERVAEVVVVGPDELWAGLHTHDASHSPHPGGLYPDALPPEAPSRAYLKLEAVLEWWGRAPSGVAIELGSAPGGASHALLSRGLELVGVDPGQMDPRVLAHPRFRHVEASINVLPLERLPARADWIVADMNVKAELTLEHASRLAERCRASGLILTLKLRSYAEAERLPRWIAQLRGAGFGEVRAKQLSPHRSELALVAAR